MKKLPGRKGGIIKKNVPVIIGKVPAVSKHIFRKIAIRKNSELIFSENKYSVNVNKKSENGFEFSLNGKDRRYKKLFFPIIGDYQINNVKTLLTALDELEKIKDIIFNEKVICYALNNLKRNSGFFGRFELISRSPKIVIDVSHNLQGIKNVKSNLKYFKYEELIVIFAMMKDKDYMSCVNELSKLDAKKIILTKPDYKRAAKPVEMFNSLLKNMQRFEIKQNVREAFDYAMSLSSEKDLILLTGSFFLVSEFLSIVNSE